MPDRDYYLVADARNTPELYRKHIEALLGLIEVAGNVTELSAAVLNFETGHILIVWWTLDDVSMLIVVSVFVSCHVRTRSNYDSL